MSGANDKTGVGSGSGEWQTPPELFAQLDRLFAFDHDAFASDENHLTPSYSTATHTVIPNAHMLPVRIEGSDGLTHPWDSWRVFGNPPYSRGFMLKAVEKAIAERDSADVIVLLVPAAVDVKWYRLLEKFATIHLLPKRVRFIDPSTGNPGDSPPTGHAIAVLRPSWMDR